MKIIVTGSLGHVGRPLTKELADKGHSVTVISSKAEKKKDIEALGAVAAIGSLEDVDFLKSTFVGADAAFLMVPPDFKQPDQVAYYEQFGLRYAKAIQGSGIRHVVHLSSYGADLDKGTGFILGSHKIERILNALDDISVTHLRAGYFYYNLYNFVHMIKTLGFIGSNFGGADKMVVVAPPDIAAVAAQELQADAVGKKVRYVVSEECTANEIAQTLGEAIGKPGLQWLVFPDEQTLEGLKQAGVPQHAADMLVEIGSSIHNGVMLKEYERNRPDVMGKIKVQDFAKEFAAAYHQ